MSPFAVLLVAGSLTCLMAQPRYTADGQLTLPSDYREWVFLSSGLGMTYQHRNSGACAGVYQCFRESRRLSFFRATGKWPDKTMLVLEVRASASKGSINQAGSYQSDVLAIEAEVKDSAKFPGNGWAFFAFGKSNTGKMLARSEDCYGCHLRARSSGQHFCAVLSGAAGDRETKGHSDTGLLHESAAQR